MPDLTPDQLEEFPVCANPEECCRELSRVWEALGVTYYIPGRGSCSEQVAALRVERDALVAMARPKTCNTFWRPTTCNSQVQCCRDLGHAMPHRSTDGYTFDDSWVTSAAERARPKTCETCRYADNANTLVFYCHQLRMETFRKVHGILFGCVLHAPRPETPEAL